jgi:hypothetical protein
MDTKQWIDAINEIVKTAIETNAGRWNGTAQTEVFVNATRLAISEYGPDDAPAQLRGVFHAYGNLNGAYNRLTKAGIASKGDGRRAASLTGLL